MKETYKDINLEKKEDILSLVIKQELRKKLPKYKN